MSESDCMQESLANFTRRFDESSGKCFSELRKSSFFDAIPGEWLMLVAEHARIRSFAAGERITNDGDRLGSFYVILYGTTTVLIYNKVVGTIVAGECIGEGTFFANEHFMRTASVVADEEVIVAEIDKDGINALLNNDKVMNYINKALLLALFKKLQCANRRIQDLTAD